jgi:putative FmdB family regulatory protein
MPAYNYHCLECNKNFEIVAGFKQVVIGEITCPDCKSKEIKRNWNVPNIIYKGNGWGKDNKND